MKVSEILKATGGRLIRGDLDLEVSPARFSTDTRTLKRGDFFVAIKGPNFDGNNFISEAFRKGAVGAIVSEAQGSRLKAQGANYKPQTIILVKDTTWAYGAVARHHRLKFDIPLIAVTGSNGKTTTKDMIWTVLSGKFNVLRNEGTKNNQIGLSQALLALKKDREVAVLELGMNHPGEIKALSRIAIPSIGAVTNIGPSHIEFLGSLDGVFKAKRELLDSMGAGAVAVLNGDDEFLAAFKSKRLKIVTFGFGRHNDFRAQAARFDGRAWRFLLNGKYPFELNLLGRQNVYNALCAIAVASNFAVGFDGMRDRLSTFRPSGMRLALARVAGVDFINDAYNSNPLSMRWALGAVSDYRTSGRRFVVSGDMLELGKLSRPLHERIGEFVALSGADYLFTMGKFSEYARASAIRHGMDRGRVKGCSDHAAVARLLKRLAKPSDVVLVKGSRAMKMEEVINRFREMM